VGVLTASIMLSFALGTFAANHAIVIGISDYKDRSIEDLRYAAADARAVREALIALCEVPDENIELLVGRSATKRNIEAAFTRVSQLDKPEDTVFLYYSGHGSFVRDADGDEADGDHLDETLLPYDAVRGREDTQIIDDIFGYWISRLDSRSVIVLLDACHSGGHGKGVSAEDIPAKGGGDSLVKDIFTDPNAKPGRGVLAACGSGEKAFESLDLEHGVFTYFLLQGLQFKQADATGDGAVTLGELARFVEDQVTTWGLETALPQRPSLEAPTATDVIVVPSSASKDVALTFGARGPVDLWEAALPGLASVAIPGWGQLLNGETGKALLHLGGYAATFLVSMHHPTALAVSCLLWSAFSGWDAYTTRRDLP